MDILKKMCNGVGWAGEGGDCICNSNELMLCDISYIVSCERKSGEGIT